MMSPKEHLLMITMLARQYQAIGVFAAVLRSRDLLTAQDYNAFRALLLAELPPPGDFLEQVRQDYVKVAEVLGVPVPLGY